MGVQGKSTCGVFPRAPCSRGSRGSAALDMAGKAGRLSFGLKCFSRNLPGMEKRLSPAKRKELDGDAPRRAMPERCWGRRLT